MTLNYMRYIGDVINFDLKIKLTFLVWLFCFVGASANTDFHKAGTSLHAKDAVIASSHFEKEGEIVLQRVIQGNISDMDGIPLPGASIVEKGTTNGTQSDFDGNFSLDVANANATLVISYIGYATKEVVLSGQKEILVRLEESASGLDEVVVTALGIKREKKAVGYAVTELKGDSFTEARETNIADGLQGKVAGVNVSNIASGPAGSSRVLIRGNASLQGNNQPLYVVDGIPIDNQNLGSPGQWGGRDQGDGIGSLNPDDVESLTVLKGNTAGALYGYRAANGVILITTKSGKLGQGLQLEVNSNFVVDNAINYLDTQREYGHGAKGLKPTTLQEALAGGDTAWGGRLDGSSVIQFDGVSRPYSYSGDNFRKFYRTGSTFTNTVSLSGGTEKMGFRFSASDLANTGIIPENGMNRNTFTINAHGKVAEKLSFQTSATYILQKTVNPPAQGDLIDNVNYTVWSLPPSINVLDLKGTQDAIGTKEDGREFMPATTIFFDNPYFSAYQKDNISNRNRLIGNISFQYDFTDWIYLRARTGIDQWNRDNLSTRPWGTGQSPLGWIQQSQWKFNEINSDVLLGSNKDFDNGFGYDVVFGASQMKQKNFSNSTNGSDFGIPGWTHYSNTLNRTGDVSSSELGVNSVYGSATFSYKSRLFLTATGRNDWYSTLNGGDTFYPSVSLSGLISEMVTLPKEIRLLKLRAAWAQVGGGAGSPYSLNQSYSLGRPHNNIPQGTISQDFVANADLVPYTVSEMEFGLEAILLNNRLSLDFTYYDKKTENDILSATISGASGYGSALINVGELTNKGVEFLISGTPVKNENFSWDLSLNLSNNINKVVSLIDPEVDNEVLVLDQNRTQTANISNIEGLPFGQIEGWKT
ncbi:MAG TPA: SusC/RagA family TonB-linked outer membrane protein [Arenibacter sp.]|nr:SusC/RagA family TonB-linked outer membrane protein [Arenibacter sp.]